jgi:hypothetical protein
MKKIWKFLINSFIVATKGSYKTALKISTYLDAQLLANKADPFILTLYQTYHPLHLSLDNAYAAWKTQMGTQKGSTQNIDTLLSSIPGKLDVWMGAVVAVFAKKSKDFKAIFPNLRKPFTIGDIDQRINAIKQLFNALPITGPLASVRAEVEAFYNSIVAARASQLGYKGTTEQKSKGLDAAYIAAMQGQYGILGLFMNQFKTNPLLIEPYFDIDAIQKGSQTKFMHAIAIDAIYTIMEHTFAATDELLLTNNGNTELVFYLAHSATDKPGTTIITVASGSELLVTAADLGDVIANHFLNVKNNDLQQKGHCVVDLL